MRSCESFIIVSPSSRPKQSAACCHVRQKWRAPAPPIFPSHALSSATLCVRPKALARTEYAA